jgi:hypothetical protein
MTPIDLMKLNVNEHTEKKNGLTYLSWAWAWAEALKADPTAAFWVQVFDGKPYMDVNGTGMVWVTVKMLEQERTCMLPVMDYKNRPIPSPDAFQVNTAIMRCMTKCLSLFGLGLYIYSGEDTPPSIDDVKPVTIMPIVDGLTAEMEVNTGDDDKNENLFAESMIHYTTICKDIDSLNSYWKANQAQLTRLKVSHPELWTQVRNRFAELKKQYKEKAVE